MSFPLTTIVKNLLIINGLIFLAQQTFNKEAAYDLFAQHHFLSKDFRPHQIITALFMHGSIEHLLGNMLGLYMFGTKLELVWGPRRFLTFYLVCGIGANILSGVATLVETYPVISDVNFLQEHLSARNFNMMLSKYDWIRIGVPKEFTAYVNQDPPPPDVQKALYNMSGQIREAATRSTLVGASGAVFGLLAGAAYLFPNDVILAGMFFPLKMKWFALIYAGGEVYLALQNRPDDQVAHVAHIGGALVGFLMVYYSYRRGNRRKLF